MREIIFRGKTLDKGEWVYGVPVIAKDYIADKDITVMVDNPNEIVPREGLPLFEQVDPKTVGQYTGLKDRNGKKIFEGDILSAHLDDAFPDEETRGCVCWNDYGWHIEIGAHLETLEQDWVGHYFEIIGNIHDNPELLEGGIT